MNFQRTHRSNERSSSWFAKNMKNMKSKKKWEQIGRWSRKISWTLLFPPSKLNSNNTQSSSIISVFMTRYRWVIFHFFCRSVWAFSAFIFYIYILEWMKDDGKRVRVVLKSFCQKHEKCVCDFALQKKWNRFFFAISNKNGEKIYENSLRMSENIC